MDDFIFNIFIFFFKLVFFNLRLKFLVILCVVSVIFEFVVVWSKMFFYIYMSRYEIGKNDDINFVIVIDIFLLNLK